MTDDRTGPDLARAYALRTPDDSRTLYRDWARTYDDDFVARHAYRLAGAVAEVYRDSGGGWPCLDVGCGTGAVAAALPANAVIDGLDLSPEMLASARAKGLYRDLFERDLTRPLDLPQGSYAGLVSSGTFTHGHVGPEALAPLVALLRPGGIGVLAVNTGVFEAGGFDAAVARLVADGTLAASDRRRELNYADPTRAPEGRGADTSEILILRRPAGA